jgi:RNA polymerase sigma factor (sigma-70 family)
VKHVAATRERSTFRVRPSVVVMDRFRSTAIASANAEPLLRSFVQGERGGKLRSQLEALHPEASVVEIEGAIQTACERFVERAEGISDPGHVYTWIRTTAHRVLNEEDDRHTREFAIDPTDYRLQELPAEEPTPEEELISGEDETELGTLVQEVADSLPERARNVLALYGAGYKRPQIASRLGLRDSTVKRDLVDILDQARGAIARRAGGGCRRGEPLVLRAAYGLATATESEQARAHMARCRRCEVLGERLDAWRERVPALLPAPAVEQASPGIIERLGHRAADQLVAMKEQILGGASQLKQQTAATYYRAVDPTPLAAARPGTVAAVVAGCLTIGGGAATYCVEQGVNPLGAATGLIAGTEEPKPEEPAPAPEAPESTAVVPPPTPVESEEPVVSELPPQPEPEPEPQPEPPPPPPEQSFEPASPDYPATEAEAEYEAPEPTSSASAQPAPVSDNRAPQFGGP